MASNHDNKQGGLVTTAECEALAREFRDANAEALFEGCFGMTRAEYEASEAQSREMERLEADGTLDRLADEAQAIEQAEWEAEAAERDLAEFDTDVSLELAKSECDGRCAPEACASCEEGFWESYVAEYALVEEHGDGFWLDEERQRKRQADLGAYSERYRDLSQGW